MWEAIKDIGRGIVESRSGLPLIAGVVLLLVGAAGGIQYNQWLPINDAVGRYVLMVAGGLMACAGLIVLLGVFKATAVSKDQVLDAREYGFEIIYPRSGDAVDTKVNVRGTFKKRQPPDYEVRLLRFYSSNRFYPMDPCELRPDNTWEALQCQLSGDTGDVRYISVCLVGPSGKALLDYHKTAEQKFNETLRKLGHEGDFIPLISRLTADMIECHRISVIRK